MGRAADWAFTKRFRRRGFGWRGSRLASERIAEALAEIHAVARHGPLHAADGAVGFLVKLSPALEQVDRLLTDLIATTPGEESKWFAMAKTLKRFDLAM